jgi:hypothetical protein
MPCSSTTPSYSDMLDENSGNDQHGNRALVSRVADLEVIRI